MNPDSISQKVSPAYTDEQVLEALRRSNDSGQLILKWFFAVARDYAQQYLFRQFPGLGPMEWDVVFSNTHLRLLTRARKGLELNEGTQLTTYYTGVAKFATMDYIQDRKKSESSPIDEYVRIEYPALEEEMDRKGRTTRIREWLQKVVGNTEQVEVLLWHARGYSFREIVEKTGYESEGACRNANMKGRNKITKHLLDHPESRIYIEKLLKNG